MLCFLLQFICRTGRDLIFRWRLKCLMWVYSFCKHVQMSSIITNKQLYRHVLPRQAELRRLHYGRFWLRIQRIAWFVHGLGKPAGWVGSGRDFPPFGGSVRVVGLNLQVAQSKVFCCIFYQREYWSLHLDDLALVSTKICNLCMCYSVLKAMISADFLFSS